jgi:glycosyltransferase involved in cell wall biosynthesis
MNHLPRKLISICVPVYREEDNVRPLYDRVKSTMDGLAERYDWELIFTDNHSDDSTFERLIALSHEDKRVRVIRFSRNFGYQRSILANYNHARGAAAVQLDCDLQDPPELIVEFLRLWEQGYKVVYGVRRARPQESRALVFMRRLFYRLIDLLSEYPLPHDAGDFRLIDRCILDQLRAQSDQQPYLRGLIASMGFNQIGLTYDRVARKQGTSKFNLRQLTGLAIDGILHHSIVPLRIATAIGLTMFAVVILSIGYIVFARLMGADWPAGWAAISVMVLFSIGLNALLLGIIGEYVGRIFKNVKTSPVVIVENVVDHTGLGSTNAIGQNATNTANGNGEHPRSGRGES